MENLKRNWIIWFVAAVIVIFLIFGFTSFNRKNTPSTPQTGHDQHEASTSTQGELSSQNSTATNQNEEIHNNTGLNQYLAKQDQIMTTMMKNMDVDPTGNASIDFLKGMIPHHESAVEMSRSYLNYGGTNYELKDLAEDIIEDQTDEIEEMQELIQEIEASGKTDKTKEEGYLKAYNQMMSNHQHMNHAASSYQDVEQAFAEGMLIHHQMAVDMAKAILDYTDHEDVRELAQDIIKTQEKEINEMEQILKTY